MSADGAGASGIEPDRDCPLCPRLAAFRETQRASFPDWHNAPVPAFGPLEARLLIVGLAPGLRGANRTGRPFTGDHAGALLYPTLLRFGFAQGIYAARPDDGLRLTDCRISNAVRCVPPANKPETAEAAACRRFLTAEIAAMPRLQAVLALGGIAHQAVLASLGLKRAPYPFIHGTLHSLPGGVLSGGLLPGGVLPGGVLPGGVLLADSYHCSRYNTNTGRLTPAMFDAVFAGLRQHMLPPG